MATTTLAQDIALLREAADMAQFSDLPAFLKEPLFRLLEVAGTVEKVPEHLFQCRAAMQNFCNRVELGEVRSVKTYNEFKALLEATK